MTTADDRQVLLDYADWRETLTLGDPDTSIEAFLQHRETEANTSRVERALASVDIAAMNAAYEEIDAPTLFEQQAASVLSILHATLAGDRPYVDEHSFGDASIRRVYTS